ncbi:MULTISPECIES: helix-turn-helix transcriptional regulator [Streptacidiphilus]|uniref:Helix-turn-helix domain-containing protein n=1 Tax=Streptacidiphilus cavernicola TaxID=3342716 RepID=A0ABV6UJ84_9ACTN|nr:helix-turn-helix transcriptional regulator [Streptacidiphilus jeojiense]
MCRSAACRKRARSRIASTPLVTGPSTPERYDRALQLFAHDFAMQVEETQRLVSRTVAGDPDLDPLALLDQLNDVQHGLTDLQAFAVQQTRSRHPNLTWKAIGGALEVSAPTASTRWSSDRTWRMLVRREARLDAKRRTESVFERRPTRSDPAACNPSADTRTADASTDHTVGTASDPVRQLSSAMSHLQRSSTSSIRALAEVVGVSPSYVSRVLSGERLPSWKLTKTLAEACQGDPDHLRPLWEAARGLRPRLLSDSAASELHAAVSGLYLAAARPAPARLCSSSAHQLTAQQVSSFLAGTIPDWPVVRGLVSALHGRPEEVRPLWEQTPAARPSPSASLQTTCDARSKNPIAEGSS